LYNSSGKRAQQTRAYTCCQHPAGLVCSAQGATHIFIQHERHSFDTADAWQLAFRFATPGLRETGPQLMRRTVHGLLHPLECPPHSKRDQRHGNRHRHLAGDGPTHSFSNLGHVT